ncbi:MAG: PAS domain S-box protein, partial [Chrysiogenales bacterium]
MGLWTMRNHASCGEESSNSPVIVSIFPTQISGIFIACYLFNDCGRQRYTGHGIIVHNHAQSNVRMKLHKDLKAKIRKYFGNLKSLPDDMRGLIHEINGDFLRLSEAGDDHSGQDILYRLLADNITDIILITDLFPRLLFASPSCLSMIGYTNDELIHMRIDEFMAPDSYAWCIQTLAHELEAEKKGDVDPHRSVLHDVEYIRKDGSRVWAELRITFIRENGKPTGLIGVSRDISIRRGMEEKLRMSEERYRTIFETLEDGYYEVDLKGRFVFSNRSFCRMMGYSPEELIGMSFRDTVPQETHEKLFRVFNKVYLEDRPEKITTNLFIRKDGFLRYGEGSVSLRQNSAGEKVGFFGIIRDGTEKKRMEEALRESEQKWRILYNNIPGGSFVVDQNSTISDVNVITCDSTGY